MSTAARSATLEIDGVTAHLRVRAVHGVERIHEPYRYVVTCDPQEDGGGHVDVPHDALLTKDATLHLAHADGSERVIHALVDAVDASGRSFRLDLVPKVALLDDTEDFKVFLDLDAVAIATQLLGDAGLVVDDHVVRKLAKRAQCVQAFESTLAFVSRILAAEGVAWFCAVDAKDKIVLCDDAGGFAALPDAGELPTYDGSDGFGAAEAVFHARLRHQRSVDKVTFREWDFTKPGAPLEVDSGSGALEWYEFPGGYDKASVGKDLAHVRLQQLQAARRQLTAETTSRRLAPGYVVQLADPTRVDVDGRWLVVEVTHQLLELDATARHRYVARFRAVPASKGFRPGQRPAPRLGMQTAVVTGPSGQEIHTEQHGGSKVHLRWDRLRPMNETSSTWVRVMQPPTSGSMLIPRMTWEALVEFSRISADAPFLLGRLYNGTAKPPSSLPGNKVVSAFGTATTPGGGSVNGITMNDTKGSEGFAIAASKDFNEKTENDKAASITANDSSTIGANRKRMVGNNHQVAVGAAQTYTVGATRTVNTDANMAIASGSETVMIGGLRVFNVGGDYTTQCSTLTRLVGAAKVEAAIEHQNRVVTGAATVLVGGAWNCVGALGVAVKVLGASTEVVAGLKSITAAKVKIDVRGAMTETLGSRTIDAGGDRVELFGAVADYSIGGAATFKGANVVICADTSLTIKASGVTLKLTPSSCVIDGKFDSSVASADSGNENYS